MKTKRTKRKLANALFSDGGPPSVKLGTRPRDLSTPPTGGIADLVGFTAQTQQLDTTALAEVVGRFETGEGAFYSDETIDGRPVRVRFLWLRTTGDSPRWEQAMSVDGGATWSAATQLGHHGPRLEGNPRKKTGGEKEQTVNNPVMVADRETGIIRHLAAGESNKAIALALNIREATVKTHVKKILKKLGLANRVIAPFTRLGHRVVVFAADENGDDDAMVPALERMRKGESLF